MPQRVQTPISGISTTSTYEDGATYSLVNLRPKNGALHPVPPRKVLQELSREYDIIFIHQNNDYQNWIGVVNEGDSSSVYWDIKNDPKLIAADILGPINSVQQVGNTLSLITSDNVFYLLYQDDNYRHLGTMPDLPILNMKTSDVMFHKQLFFKDEYGDRTITPTTLLDATKGLVNKAMNTLMEEQGLMLFDACFIRYAFRLYDGTLTKHSPPILAVPVRPILGGTEDMGHSSTYDANRSIKGIKYNFAGGVLHEEDRIDVLGYRIEINYDTSQLWDGTSWNDYSKWKDMIQSVDIFMSPPIGISNIEDIRKDLPTTEGVINYLNLIKKTPQEITKLVTNSSSFYLIESIPLGEKTPFEKPKAFPSADSSISKMENLIHQEAMKDDSFSNHKYGASVSYAYNNRLHLAGLKTTFFRGFSPSFFQWGSSYNNTTPPVGRAIAYVAEVEIYTGASTEKAYSTYTTDASTPILFASAFLSYTDPRARKMTIYEIMGSMWKKAFEAKLEAHPLLNLAYYLNNELNPVIANLSTSVPEIDTSKPVVLSEPNKIKVSELNNPLVFPNINTYQVGTGAILAMATNAMNVSDRNFGQFPLYVFTTRGIWTLNVGSGEVVYSNLTAPTSMESPTTPVVGETPYGVVFASQRGLMIINGQSVDFISPQIEQVPAKLNIEMNSHCGGVVFQPEIKKFSELLKGLSGLVYNPYENELIANVSGTELNYVLDLYDRVFYQSTEKIDLVVGNAFPELLVVRGNKLKDYAASDSPLAHVGFITRPLQYGTPDIKRLERVILRALIYNATKFENGKFPLYMVHYSMDRVNFKALTGFPIKDGHNRDLDSGLLSRPKFSYGLFTMAGLMSEESEIEYLDTVFDKEYNNTKMR